MRIEQNNSIMRYKHFAFFVFVMIVSLCSCANRKDLRAKLIPQINEAYEGTNWIKILGLIDSLQNNKENIQDLWLIHSEALVATEQTDKALELLNKKTIEEPDNYYSFHSLGNVYWIRNELDKAIENYTKAIEIRPTYARSYINRAEVYKQLSKDSEAVDSYMEAIRLFVQNEFYAEVKMYVPKVLAIDSTYTLAHSFLAYVYNEEKDYHSAAHLLYKAFKIEFENDNPRCLETMSFLGQTLYKSGEFEEAIRSLEIALLNQSSDHLWINYCYLACCYNKLKNTDKFEEYKKKASDINFENTQKHIEFLLSLDF